MRTITIEVVNEAVVPLLENLEKLELLRLPADEAKLNGIRVPFRVDYETKYEGKMAPQQQEETDRQLKELRDEWTRDDQWS